MQHCCMVICFNATQEAKRAVDSLIETRQFKDTSEAISMALVNYEVIQRAVEEKHQVIQADLSPVSKSSPATAQTAVATARRSERTGVPSLHVPRQIPSLFELTQTRQ